MYARVCEHFAATSSITFPPLNFLSRTAPQLRHAKMPLRLCRRLRSVSAKDTEGIHSRWRMDDQREFTFFYGCLRPLLNANRQTLEVRFGAAGFALRSVPICPRSGDRRVVHVASRARRGGGVSASAGAELAAGAR